MFLIRNYIALLIRILLLHFNSMADSLTVGAFNAELDLIYRVLAKQDIINQELKEETRSLKEETRSLKEETRSLKEETRFLKEETRSLKNIIAEQTQQILDLQAQLQRQVHKSSEDPKYIYQQYGCDQESIILSCEPDQLINVTYAIYGMNSEPCSKTCCPPVPSDCSELVSENDIANWLSLKYACDNQTSCTYEYSGEVINDCEPSYVADYMHIFYTCLPVSDTAAIGFTVRLSAPQHYQIDEMVRFDLVVTNYGNLYQPSTGYFICPRHGMYLFGLNIYSHDDIANLDLMIQNVKAGEVNVDGAEYRHAGFQIIVECHVGDIVWVKTSYNSYVFTDQNCQSQFYGSFLQTLE